MAVYCELDRAVRGPVILDTRKQKYCVWIDDEPLALNVPFDDPATEDFLMLGLGTFDTSTAVIGIDNIVIKGIPGMALPGVNLLLLD